MEIQLIHIHERYEGMSITQALTKGKEDGKMDTLAILSVLLEYQKSDNSKLNNLFEAVTNVTDTDDEQKFSGIKLSQLLPRNTDGFYRYNGSLTYPNCIEAAIWTVFKVGTN